MKLRNKKTGEIKDACEVLDMKQEDGVLYKYRERRPSKSIKNPKGAGRPRIINRVTTKTSQDGLRDGLTRATFIVPEKTLAEIKEIL